ncbi:MAG: hypothetical protein HQK54_00980 [Oligoflexales bacterium]|nr:hypothetical protein [Oligoflexales bacterium]
MKKSAIKLNLNFFIIFLISTVLLLSFARSYMRIQTTLIGYELGKLKKIEASMLEKRSQLQMELAKLTTKSHLIILSKEAKSTQQIGAVAVY